MLLAVPVYGEGHAVRLADGLLSFSLEQPVRGITELLHTRPAPPSDVHLANAWTAAAAVAGEIIDPRDLAPALEDVR